MKILISCLCQTVFIGMVMFRRDKSSAMPVIVHGCES